MRPTLRTLLVTGILLAPLGSCSGDDDDDFVVVDAGSKNSEPAPS